LCQPRTTFTTEALRTRKKKTNATADYAEDADRKKPKTKQPPISTDGTGRKPTFTTEAQRTRRRMSHNNQKQPRDLQCDTSVDGAAVASAGLDL
jgi:hypothetical protein